LALLEKLDERIEKNRLQKLIFLLTNKQKNPDYEFVPYHFGCYSYSLSADLKAMIKRKWVAISDEGYGLKTEKKYYNELRSDDKIIVDGTISLYGKMNTEQITKHTYFISPYHAINSTIARNILPEKYYLRVQDAKPKIDDTILFTVGYEGISLEEYLNKLIKNDVKLLIDVRKNPLSQKYGFSKKLLSGFCKKLNTDYLHIPEVGIDSSKRKELNTQKDYDTLFEDYCKTVLEETKENQNYILRLLKEKKRIALTCFEAESCQCHRTHLAEKLKKSSTFKYKLKHI